ncbi:ribbon-helix-helix protein, CopG family [Burkholderia sp. Bp9017]|nr:ribbon-helix-helix protein, CopG family [Burkholderia sp. Bp9017]RQZ35680.1 ribbon-helix-helix protein, CopG family [Burkholderia sp. Bp9016]
MATSIKLDPTLQGRVRHLAEQRRRPPHWIMREAIAQYVTNPASRPTDPATPLADRPGAETRSSNSCPPRSSSASAGSATASPAAAARAAARPAAASPTPAARLPHESPSRAARARPRPAARLRAPSSRSGRRA